MANYTEVFAWGGDHLGQLGLAAKQSGKTYCVPRFCSFNVFIKQIACGEEHSAFIAHNGCVYTMGSNSEGRLGIGSRSVRQSASPCLVESLSSHPADSVSCGWGHTAVVCGGSVFAWGVGEYGALGLGAVDTQWFPAQVRLPADVAAVAVSCGSRHTAILVGEGRSHRRTLLMTGAGEAGQLGTGKREKEQLPVRLPFTEEVRQVSCGVFHTAFVTDAGRVYAMGGNSFGQLGLGTKKSSSIPARVAALDGVQVVKVACGHHTGAISDQGDLYLWGTGAFGEFLSPQVVTNIPAHFLDLDIGGSFGAAVDSQSCVYTWGSNTNGELGLGDYEQRVSPSQVVALLGKRVKAIACGGSFCLALGADVGVVSAGRMQRKPSFQPVIDSLSPIKPVRSTDAVGKDARRSQPAERDLNRTKSALESTQRTVRDAEDDLSRKAELAATDFARTNRDSFTRRLEADHSRLLQTTKDLEGTVAAKDREIVALRSLNEQLKRGKLEMSETSVLYRKLDALNSSFEDLAAESQNKENEIAELRVAHEKVATERDKLEVLVREKEAALALSRAISEKTTFSRKETEDLFRRKDSELSTLRSEIRTLESALAAKDRELAGDKYKLDLLSSDKQQADSDLAAARTEVARVLANLDDAQRANADLKRELDARNSEYATVVRELDANRRDRQELKAGLGARSDGLQRQNEELKALLDAKCAEVATLRRDMDSAVQVRSVLTSDYSKTISDLDAAKQQIADLRSRLTDRDADLSDMKQNFEALNRDRNSLQQHIARLESDLSAALAARDKLSVGLEQQLKVTNQVKFNSEDHCRRYEAELRRKDEDHQMTVSKVREALEERCAAVTSELAGVRRTAVEERQRADVAESENRKLQEALRDGRSREEAMNRQVENLLQLEKAKDEQLSQLMREGEDLQQRSSRLQLTSEELQKELDRTRVQLSSSLQDLRGLEDSLRRADERTAALTQENNQAKATIEELKYEVEKLYQQQSDALKEMNRLQDLNEGLHDQYQRTQNQCESMSREIADLEAKNKELFRTFEQGLANRARDFRERSLNALGTPSPLRPTQSPLPEEKSLRASAAKTTARTLSSTLRVKGESPERRTDRYGGTVDFSRKISKAAERMMEAGPSPLANLRISSPMRKQGSSPSKRVEFSPAKNPLSFRDGSADLVTLMEEGRQSSLRGSVQRPDRELKLMDIRDEA